MGGGGGGKGRLCYLPFTYSDKMFSVSQRIQFVSMKCNLDANCILGIHVDCSFQNKSSSALLLPFTCLY